MDLVTLGLLLVMAGLVAGTAVRQQPGLGIIGALLLLAGWLWWRGEGVAPLGWVAPESWTLTLLWSAGLGVGIQLFSVLLLEPWTERVTGTEHDHAVVDAIRGNWRALLPWLVIVWLFVAFLEEILFRGFMLTAVADLLGGGAGASLMAIVVSSFIFGLAHWYQDRAGMLSTALIGAVLGIIYVVSGRDLWLVILTHGFIDTVGLVAIWANWDRRLKSQEAV